MSNVLKLIGFAVSAISAIAVFSLLMPVPLWLLWNWLMPELFGLKEIELLQALGLLFLSGMLFKSSSSSSSNDSPSRSSARR